MKKLVALLSVTLVIMGCNNASEEKTTPAGDSLKAAESPLMDAVNTADSANKILHDSTHTMMDTTYKK